MYQRQKNFLLHLACILSAAALGYIAIRYLLVWLLPFLLALAVTMALNPAVEFCRTKLRCPRTLTAALLTFLLVVLILTLGFGITFLLLRQLCQLLEDLPGRLNTLNELLTTAQRHLQHLTTACPGHLRHWMEQLTALFLAQLTAVAKQGSAAVLSWLARAMTQLPRFFLACITTVLATFFTCAAYPTLRSFLRRQFSDTQWAALCRGKQLLRTTFGSWLRAEGLLLVATFVQLLVGFLFLRQPYALLLALLIALVDALPVLGLGMILVPWGLICLLTHQLARGIALLVLYGIISLVRSFLEPKLMASQAGLPPLAALAAMYIGFCMLGISGMILFPLLLLFLKQLHDTGLLRLWK